MERRRTKRVEVDLKIVVQKCVSAKDMHDLVLWTDSADLKNVSFLGAYFVYHGSRDIVPEDIMTLDMDVLVQNNTLPEGESLPLSGFAKVVRVQEKNKIGIGVGVEFLQPLSLARFS